MASTAIVDVVLGVICCDSAIGVALCVLTWLEGSYVAVVLMALVLLPWLSSVRAKQPKVYKHTGKGTFSGAELLSFYNIFIDGEGMFTVMSSVLSTYLECLSDPEFLTVVPNI